MPTAWTASSSLAASTRRQMPARVVAITGTAGKTSTKEMALADLRKLAAFSVTLPWVEAEFRAKERKDLKMTMSSLSKRLKVRFEEPVTVRAR